MTLPLNWQEHAVQIWHDGCCLLALLAKTTWATGVLQDLTDQSRIASDVLQNSSRMQYSPAPSDMLNSPVTICGERQAQRANIEENQAHQSFIRFTYTVPYVYG